jgi:hypothetical protein
MIRLQGNERLFISEDLLGFTDELDKQGTIPRMVDILFLGFGYAVKNSLMPAEDYKRRPIVAVMSIEPDMMLAIEATAQWYAKQFGLNEPQDETNLLVLICSIGIAGARELQKRWEVRSKSQIQMDIISIIEQS